MHRILSAPTMPPPKYLLAFLYQQDSAIREGLDGQSRVFQFEALDCRWFRRKIVRNLDLYSLGNALVAELDGGDFASTYARLTLKTRQRLYRAHRQYMALMTHARTAAPVYLVSARFDVQRRTTEQLDEGTWYWIDAPLTAREKTDESLQSSGQIFVSPIATNIHRDEPTWFGEGASIDTLPEWAQTLLQALHFPQSEPKEEGPPGNQGQTGGAHSQGGNISQFAVATAGATAAAAAVPKNPMIYASDLYQPFVGVNWVGAGNNISLYGHDGSICAHVDFGYPTRNHEGSYDDTNDPCVCDDAPLILSHWDFDHYAMVRKKPDALRRRWLAPQQVFGPVAAREVYARLLNEIPFGAELAIWPASAGGGHFATDFGYIERATGKPGNDDCLAVFVRVKDDPKATPTGAPIYGPRTLPPRAKSTGAGLIANGPLVLNGALCGVTLPNDLKHRTLRGLIAVPIDAHPSLQALAAAHARGKKRFKLPAGGPAHWIAPEGIPRAEKASAHYIPVIGTHTWQGGWALQPTDFVKLGGVMIDFPPKKHPQRHLVCVSPTPGTPWANVADPMPPGLELLSTTSLWKPAWKDQASVVTSLEDPNLLDAFPVSRGAQTLTVNMGPATTSSEEHYVLLPGDAGFQFLPSSAPSKGLHPSIVGLMATHHGAKSWFQGKAAGATNYIPSAPENTGKIVYSYGTEMTGPNVGRHYYYEDGDVNGHPNNEAVDEYVKKGWGVTAAGPGFVSRLNTATRDFDSKQSFNPLSIIKGTPTSDANRQGHFNGNVALGWDKAANSALKKDIVPRDKPAANIAGQVGPQPLRRTCSTCKKIRFYYF